MEEFEITSLVKSVGIVLLLEIILFAILYRFTRLQGKQVALVVATIAVGLFIPVGIIGWRSLDYFAIHVTFFATIPYVMGIITTHWEIREEEKNGHQRRWFHWGPATMVAFFIGLATVDSFIISVAEKGLSESAVQRFFPASQSGSEVTSFFPGTVSHDFHEKEEQFNEYLKAQEKQRKQGWQVRKGWLHKPSVNQPATFKVVVTDKSGNPVDHAVVDGKFLRPSDSHLDVAFELTETDAGTYRHKITLPEPGRWDLVLEIRRGDDRHELKASTLVDPG
ncbi:MAG TPA: nitrogen fixation protein FixH [Gammaproteobacteria bacterium]|nr:nitrogen fixation protein FixH [Gammaproteobacteria bacterium]